MKFCKEGPDIPDDLLWKRDAGDVVFICGAGVSMPGAKLPDFADLALKVMDKLRISDSHDARKIWALSDQEENRGLISLDKVFGEIEHDYFRSEIEDAVEKVLYSEMKDDLSYHEIVRDLATAPDGKLRLVTTNFDNLFSQVTDVDVKEWKWPELPNAIQLKSLNGLVYLHGKCSGDGRSEGRKLVLTTSSFGEAYLTNGQAREFLKSLLDGYTVVFLGYAADDPPMQYLLEALAQSRKSKEPTYAFHRGEQMEADAKWRHRGIVPLCYNEHKHLWDTLELWRNRATNFELWANPIIEMAKSGPYVLTNLQRSQVAHLASNPIGAETLAKSEDPIPPQWLFVFDREFRYTTPEKRTDSDDDRPYRDPFDFLGLENDVAPNIISPDDYYTKRRPPNDAWDAFDISLDDAYGANDKKYYIPFCGSQTSEGVLLSERLKYMAVWIGKIAKHPLTLRWARHQKGLHHLVKMQILHSLNSAHQTTPSVIKRAWETLFEIWDEYEPNCEAKLSSLERIVYRESWNLSRISKYRRLSKPRLVAIKPSKVAEVFLPNHVPDDVRDIMPLDISYYRNRYTFGASDDHIFDILEIDRRNLERAIELNKEIKRYRYHNIPIISNVHIGNLGGSHFHGLNLLFVNYYKRFMSAYRVCPKRCLEEIESWPVSDTNVFIRLRILVAGNTKLLTPAKAGLLLASVPQDVFWDTYHKGDIVNSIKSRWKDFSSSTKKRIEKRIMAGVERLGKEDKDSYESRCARYTLDMLQWLRANKCKFDLDYARTMRHLKKKCPTWKTSLADELDKRVEISVERGGVDNVSLAKGGDMAEFYLSATISRDEQKNSNLSDILEFVRMCEYEPSKAFRLLKDNAREGEYREWMWRFWFRSNRSEERCRSYLNRTAVLLCRASTSQIAEMKSSVYDWFSHVVKNFKCSRRNLRYELSLRLLDALKEHPDACSSELVRMPGRRVEWISETANSPVGHFVEALYNYPDIVNLGLNSKPSKDFIDIASELLSLKDDGGRFAIVSFVVRSSFFYSRFPNWTSVNVIGKMKDSDATTKEAYFEGLAFAVDSFKVREIFLNIRDDLVSAFCDDISMTENTADQLSRLILCGWLSRHNRRRLVSDLQFREAMSQRSHLCREGVLWNLHRWVKDGPDNNRVKRSEVKRFFSCIWPLGRSAVSQKTNRYMLEISFSNEQMFSLLKPILDPRMIRAETFHIDLGDLVDDNSRIAKKFPEDLLNILVRSLPEEPTKWDYELSKVLDAIERAAPHLAKNYEFSSLRRKCIT